MLYIANEAERITFAWHKMVQTNETTRYSQPISLTLYNHLKVCLVPAIRVGRHAGEK